MLIIEQEGMRELTRDECDELNERVCPLSRVAVDEVKLVEQQMRQLLPERYQVKFLYHFTNPDVVGTWLDEYVADFRCTYYRDLNDRLEWFNGIEYVSEYVREHGHDALADAVESLPEKDGCAPWVCCFSENEDSAAMWGMYGDRKIGGFAVGFDKNMMMQLVDDRNSKRQSDKRSSYDYWLLPCIYQGDPRLDKIIDYILNDAHADEDEHLSREGCGDEVFARQISRMFFLTEYADKCDFGTLDNWALIKIVIAQATLANHVDWSRLNHQLVEVLGVHPDLSRYVQWDTLKSSVWAKLLIALPQYADRCDWSKIDGGDIVKVLQAHPEIEQVVEWNRISSKRSWIEILDKCPQCVKYCKWDDSWWLYLVEALSCCPRFSEVVDWAGLTERDWRTLLLKFPKYVDKCDVSKLSDNTWGELIGAYAEFTGLMSKYKAKTKVENGGRLLSCPICGAKMVLRHRKSDGSAFYGCSRFPSCRGAVDYKS